MKGTINSGTITGFSIRFLIMFVIAVFCGFSALYGADRTPIDVNLIIDGSKAFSDSKEEITSWVNSRLDAILAEGDRVTIWNAGSISRVVYTGSINSNTDRENAKKTIRDFTGTGETADFAGALREAVSKQNADFNYTLLISASSENLSSALSGPQANLFRFSKVEDFSAWRAIVVGIGIDAKVRKASASFFGSN